MAGPPLTYADLLARQSSLPYGVAHAVLKSVGRRAVENGVTLEEFLDMRAARARLDAMGAMRANSSEHT